MSTEEDWKKDYNNIQIIGMGTYGKVFRAVHNKTDKIVAVKVMLTENVNEGIAPTTMREITIMHTIDHPNVLRFFDISFLPESIMLFFDYFPFDLKKFSEKFKDYEKFDLNMVAIIMFQVLKGVQHLHSQRILHRDLKPHNILINNDTLEVKIADFGLSRVYNIPIRGYTKEVLTLWYRAPELMLDCTEYSTGIDMWSVGCIFAELITKKTLFRGENEITQTKLLFDVVGSKKDEDICTLTKLKGWNKQFCKKGAGISNYIKERFGKELNPDCYELINGMLALDPSKRMSAQQALEHKFFKDTPKVYTYSDE